MTRGNPSDPEHKVCLNVHNFNDSRSLTSRTFTQTEEVTEDASSLVTWPGPAG